MKTIIENDKTIINFDESIISDSIGRSYIWERKGAVPGRSYKSEIAGLSIMCVASSDGDIFY